MQYRKKGGSPRAVATIGDILLSPLSGGSDGTTVKVLRQLGHMKQFLAHLSGEIRYPESESFVLCHAHLFFSARTLALGTSNRQFGQ